jgi:hypothetical protein
MKPLSEAYKRKWAFFINQKTGKVQYNKKCKRCIHVDCKQSYRVEIVRCRNFTTKDTASADEGRMPQ